MKAIRTYVKLMLKPKDKATEILGMKALLVDDETVRRGSGRGGGEVCVATCLQRRCLVPLRTPVLACDAFASHVLSDVAMHVF